MHNNAHIVDSYIYANNKWEGTVALPYQRLRERATM
jgi:hypothetical protein